MHKIHPALLTESPPEPLSLWIPEPCLSASRSRSCLHASTTTSCCSRRVCSQTLCIASPSFKGIVHPRLRCGPVCQRPPLWCGLRWRLLVRSSGVEPERVPLRDNRWQPRAVDRRRMCLCSVCVSQSGNINAVFTAKISTLASLDRPPRPRKSAWGQQERAAGTQVR